MLGLKQFVEVLDLSGTFVFAISGVSAGLRRRFDVFGVLVMSFVAANFGSIARDLLIGAVPPAGIADWRYLAVSVFAGVVGLYGDPVIDRLRSPVLLFDAAGLAFFSVAGAEKALDFGLNPPMAALLGMFSGIGGGVVRDMLQAQTPTVLHSDLYAVAALAGAMAVVVGRSLHRPEAAALVGAALCFGLRYMSIRRGWRLPKPRAHTDTSPQAHRSHTRKNSEDPS